QTGEIILKQNEPIGVSARSLSFGFNSGNVLNDLSFNIKPGEIVCLQGANAAGKSTLLRLITGAFPSFTGNLLINDIPISNYDVASLRSGTGIMLHMQEIFQGTLRDNICMGEDGISYQEMDKLADMVGLKPFIDGQPEGY